MATITEQVVLNYQYPFNLRIVDAVPVPFYGLGPLAVTVTLLCGLQRVEAIVWHAWVTR
jgi:hypothetical protein